MYASAVAPEPGTDVLASIGICSTSREGFNGCNVPSTSWSSFPIVAGWTIAAVGFRLFESTSTIAEMNGLSEDDRAWIGHGARVSKLGPILERLSQEHRRRSRVLTVTSMIMLGMLTIVGTSIVFTMQVSAAWAHYFSGIEEQLKMIEQMGTMLGQ